MTKKKRSGLFNVIAGVVVMALALAAFVSEPELRPGAVVFFVVFLAIALFGCAELANDRMGPVAKIRVLGVGLLLLAVGFAAAAVALWHDPAALPRPTFPKLPQTGRVALGVIGFILCSVLGLLVLIRGGRNNRDMHTDDQRWRHSR